MKEDNYLSHHGILGQKWGVRRYQNYDGSLTSEGRRRRGYSEESTGKKIKDKVNQYQKRSKVRKAANKRALEEAKAKKRQESIEKKAQAAIDKENKLKEHLRSHPKDIYKHRNELSKADVDEIMKQVEWDRRCKDIRRDEFVRARRKIDDVKDWMLTGSNFMNTSINAYNNAALIYNAFLDVQSHGDTPRITPTEAKKRKLPKVAWAKQGSGGALYEGGAEGND